MTEAFVDFRFVHAVAYKVAVMVSVRLTVAVWAVGIVESVTLNVSTVFVPLVGVPLICPVCAFSVNPAGILRDVKAHV